MFRFAQPMVCLLAATFGIGLSGCAHLSLPRIDPTGQRIFAPHDAPLPPTAPANNIAPGPVAAWQSPATPPPCPTTAAQPVLPVQPIAPSTLSDFNFVQSPIGTGLAQPAGTGGGLLHHGQKPKVLDKGHNNTSLSLTPQRWIAPVGSEVILLAGLCGADQHFITGEQVEWMLAQGSVGQIMEIGDEGNPGQDGLFSRKPHKASGDYAIGRTVIRSQLLTRGTPNPADDVTVQAGQAWLSVSSPSEGTSRMTALARDVKNWDGRKQTAIIHWVDGQWVFPQPQVARGGEKVMLCTKVTRATTGLPVCGWIVRYEITDGNAVFTEGAVKALDVLTDTDGTAMTEIQPLASSPGTAQVCVKIIRPAVMPGDEPRLEVAQGATCVTWNAPGLTLKASGPEIAGVGTNVTYRFVVANPGTVAAANVVVTTTLPPQLQALSSTPTAQVFGNRLEWTIPNLPSQNQIAIELNCRTTQGGDVRVCAAARTNENVTSEDCAVTRVFDNTLNVEMRGPQTAEVGQTVEFQMIITNRGTEPLKNVMFVSSYDAGLAHEGGPSPRRHSLGDMPAGTDRALSIKFLVREPGQLCHAFEVTADGGQRGLARGCFNATAAPRRDPLPSMKISILGARESRAGQEVEFAMNVTNTGDTPLTNVQVFLQPSTTLRARRGTDGYRFNRGEFTWVIPRLEPGQQMKELRAVYLCTSVDRGACVRMTVSNDQKLLQTDEACLTVEAALEPPPVRDPVTPPIAPPVGPAASNRLLLTLTALDNPVRVGSAVRYVLTVKNDRATPDRNISLNLNLPVGLDFESLEGPVREATKSEDGRTISVRPIVELRAGETVNFTVTLRATRAGRLPLKIIGTSIQNTTPSFADAAPTVIQ